MVVEIFGGSSSDCLERISFIFCWYPAKTSQKLEDSNVNFLYAKLPAPPAAQLVAFGSSCLVIAGFPVVTGVLKTSDVDHRGKNTWKANMARIQYTNSITLGSLLSRVFDSQNVMKHTWTALSLSLERHQYLSHWTALRSLFFVELN